MGEREAHTSVQGTGVAVIAENVLTNTMATAKKLDVETRIFAFQMNPNKPKLKIDIDMREMGFCICRYCRLWLRCGWMSRPVSDPEYESEARALYGDVFPSSLQNMSL